MADHWSHGTEDAARLEAALDRIGRFRRSPAAPNASSPPVADLAHRLDALIAELRAALGTDAAD
jgi:hypothetical protein